MGSFILIPIVTPFLGGLFIRHSQDNRKIYRRTILTVVFNLIAFFFTIFFLNESSFELLKINQYFSMCFKIDKMGMFFSSMASILWVFTTFYAISYMDHEIKQKRFFFYFTITLGVVIGLAFSANLFTLYFFYELLTLVTFPLVIHAESKEAFASGKKYLIYSFGGAAFVLGGMALLFSISPEMKFVELGGLNEIYDSLNSLEKSKALMSFILMFLGFGVKAAIVPFHSWLPAAMVAPTPVSSLLHAVAVVKSGIFALLRLVYFVFGASVVKDMHGGYYASFLIVPTILMGSLLAISHDNLKKRLAYSTISQLGYIVLGIMMLNENALTGGLLHLINHALIKIVLFFCAGAIYVQAHEKNISGMRGIGRKMPKTLWCFTIASISLIGLPPSNGFVSKWYLALGGLHASKIFLPIVLLLSAFLTASYLLPVIITAFFPGEEEVNYEEKLCDPESKMMIPIIAITCIVVFIGIFPNFILNIVEAITNEIL